MVSNVPDVDRATQSRDDKGLPQVRFARRQRGVRRRERAVYRYHTRIVPHQSAISLQGLACYLAGSVGSVPEA